MDIEAYTWDKSQQFYPVSYLKNLTIKNKIMAEIKIEKKTMVWPWIVAGIILIAIILYFLFFRNANNNETVMAQDTTNVVMYQNDNAVTAFVTYIDSDTNSMSLDHEYTHTALIKFADATKYIADKTNYEANADIDDARKYADKITKDPMATTHANNIKKATGILSNVLLNIQQAHFPQLGTEANNLKSSSQAIDTDELTLDQKNAIKTFFNDASVLLQKMN
jgi:hypothetical protein